MTKTSRLVPAILVACTVAACNDDGRRDLSQNDDGCSTKDRGQEARCSDTGHSGGNYIGSHPYIGSNASSTSTRPIGPTSGASDAPEVGARSSGPASESFSSGGFGGTGEAAHAAAGGAHASGSGGHGGGGS